MDPNQQPATPQNPGDTNATPAPEAPVSAPAPEVQAAPEAPAPAVAPAPSFAAVAETPLATLPQKNKKTGLLIGIIGAAIVVLAGIGFLIFFLISQVSKEDYQAANTQYDKVAVEAEKLNDLGDSFMSELSNAKDAAAYDTFSEETKATLASAKTQNDELAKLKAAKFGESGKLYGKFNDKFKSSVTYKGELITSFDKVMNAMFECRKDMDTSNPEKVDISKYYKSCSDQLDAAGTLPNKALETYRKEVVAQFSTMSTVYTEYKSAVASKNQTAVDEANKKGRAASDKITEAAKTAKDSLNTDVKANDTTEEGKALKAFLDEKS